MPKHPFGILTKLAIMAAHAQAAQFPSLDDMEFFLEAWWAAGEHEEHWRLSDEEAH